MSDKRCDLAIILFKKDNSSGWYYALMYPLNGELESRCKFFASQNKWVDYKIFSKEVSVTKPNYEFIETIPEGYTMHLTTNLIYMPEYNKWYFPDEIIPCPSVGNKRLTKKFVINTVGEGEHEDFTYPETLDEYEGGTDLKIDFGSSRTSFVTIVEDIKPDLEQFIKNVRTVGYACLSNEEYTFAKILAWKIKDDRVRIVLHYYGNVSGVIVGMDKIIPAELFYEEFENLLVKLQDYIDIHEKMYKKLVNESC